MLWTLILFILALWLLGVITAYTLGGMIHLLLVLAVILLLARVMAGNRSV